jgi:hypothetical protein
MSAATPLTAAIEELYGLPPEQFTARRAELANAARQNNDPKTANEVTALRRPTNAAWILNHLVRTDSAVSETFAALGDQLRDAQRRLDGPRLRELTQQRRTTLRNEVAATLEAALADADVAEQFSAGTLLRSADWSGFGESPSFLTVVPSARPDTPSRTRAKRTTTTQPGTATTIGHPARSTARTGQREQQLIAAAEDALAAVTADLQAAGDAERAQDEQVALVAEQLADARRHQDEARLHTRQLRARQRDAERTLARARR